MAEYIVESEMKFGPYEAEKLIHIEVHPEYVKVQQGMHISEFLYHDDSKKRIVMIEAKTSAPNPNSKDRENPKERFVEFVSEIREKFENTLDLYLNMALKDNVPDGFKNINYSDIDIYFILVIKKHQREWLKDVKDALEMAVRSVHRTNNIWKCKVLVINEEMAKRSKLIVNEEAD